MKRKSAFVSVMCWAKSIISDVVRRRALCWKRVASPTRLLNCFGYDLRDRGHRRVPDPPASKTGYILCLLIVLSPLIFVMRRLYEPINRPAIKTQSTESDSFDRSPLRVYVNCILQLNFAARHYALVAGNKRVPKPATGKTAFLIFLLLVIRYKKFLYLDLVQ